MIKLSCKSCGAKLELTDDIDRFSCMHCGSEWIVNRGGGIVSLKAVEESLKGIEISSQRSADNLEVIADSVKIQNLQNKIYEYQVQKSKINLHPMKENPLYSKDKERTINNSFWNVFFTLMVIIIFLFMGDFIKYYKAGMVGGTEGIMVCFFERFFVIVGFPLVVSFFSYLILLVVFQMPPKTIINKEKQAENQSVIENINSEISNLYTQIQGIKNKN